MPKVDIFSSEDRCPDTCHNISSNRLALLDSVRSVVVGLTVKLDGRVCLESGTLDAGQRKFTRPLGASHVYPITKITTYFSGAYHAISMFLLPKTWSRSDRHCSPDFDPSGYPQPRADLSARRLQQVSLI